MFDEQPAGGSSQLVEVHVTFWQPVPLACGGHITSQAHELPHSTV
jgi:hypothetical protein